MRYLGSVGLVFLIILGGCSGKREGAPPVQKGAGLMNVAIVPERPHMGEPIEARVEIRSNPGEAVTLLYQWLRNGTPVPGAESRILDPKGLHKGDRISVRVRIQGQEGQMGSGEIRLVNSPPKIQSVFIFPQKPVVGQELAANVKAEDADGDVLSYRYQWLRNGQPVPGAAQASFSTGQTKRGDGVGVRVVASDGEDTTDAFPALPVTVSGRLPVILSQPPGEMPQGGTFTYQLIAQDPEGGRISYSLITGPPGMALNPASGLVSWTLPQERGNAYPVTVRVTNEEGSWAEQNFTLRY